MPLITKGSIPEELEELADQCSLENVVMLSATTYNLSDKSTACLQIPYFEDVGVIALQYLDMLVQKDNLQKSQFFKGLSKVIEKLPLVSQCL